MLSYRHAYHAGNHADLLKHYLLARTLAYYNEKPKPYDYIDTTWAPPMPKKTANTTAASPA